MALKHTLKIRDGQPAFEEFVCQSQRWVYCFVITATLVIVAIALNVLHACLMASWFIRIHALFILVAASAEFEGFVDS